MVKYEKEALEIIKQYQPISIYQLHRKLKVAYSTTWKLVTELEKDDKIFTEIKKIRPIKLIRIKEQENGKVE